MQQSDIAKFRQEQVLEEQAAHQALYGFASVATHTSITARMERGADRLFALFAEGKHEEALRLWETTDWALEEVICPIMTNENMQNEQSTKGVSSLWRMLSSHKRRNTQAPISCKIAPTLRS